MRLFRLWVIPCFIVLLLPGCVTKHHVYLTWQGDPGSTMTVNFQTADPLDEAKVYYDTIPHDGDPNQYTYNATGVSRQIPGDKVDGRWIHNVELTNLTPGQTYYFYAQGLRNGQERHFQTIPNDGTPLRYVVGGDMGTLPAVNTLLSEAALYDPMFAVIGGDIAYANGDLNSAYLWDKWIIGWDKNLRKSDGAMVPMVLAIGNHETNDKEGTLEERAPFYFGYFAQGGQSIFSRAFPPYLTIVAMDSGHITNHEDQPEWLEGILTEAQNRPHTMAVYHVPMYPSHRDFNDSRSVKARELWQPIFDDFGLDVAFENHDHTYKRTHRIKANELDPTGTLYLGDGSMGIVKREAVNKDAWYIHSASGTSHFWLVDVDGNGMRFRAVDKHGNVFDDTALPAPPK